MPFDWLHNLSGYELSNLVLLLGVLVASGVRRASGVNPGGIVAAAFLILAAASSVWWALSLPVMGIAISMVYRRFFSHIFLGRQPLFIMAAISVVTMTIIGTLMERYHLIPSSDLNYPLGIILPAILASTINKQGIVQTYSYTLLAVLLTAEAVAVVYLTGQSLGHDFHALDHLISTREVLHIGWGAVLAFLSVVIGYVLYRWRSVKSAGYIMLPFLATICVVSPLNFLLVIGLAIIAYGITSLFRHHSLIIGVGRYTFVTVVAITLVWTAEYVLLRTTGTFSPFMGTSIFAALAIAVIVNEHTLYGVRRTAPLLALSLAVMVGLEFGGVAVLHAIDHQSPSLHHYVTKQPA